MIDVLPTFTAPSTMILILTEVLIGMAEDGSVRVGPEDVSFCGCSIVGEGRFPSDSPMIYSSVRFGDKISHPKNYLFNTTS